jgi:hypothetical protein
VSVVQLRVSTRLWREGRQRDKAEIKKRAKEQYVETDEDQEEHLCGWVGWLGRSMRRIRDNRSICRNVRGNSCSLHCAHMHAEAMEGEKGERTNMDWMKAKSRFLQ